MKKYNTIVLFTGLLLAASLLFMGCNNAFAPSAQSSNVNKDGNVTVSFDVYTRNIMPSAMGFDTYEFTFTPDGDAPVVHETRNRNEAFSFTLEMGETYTLEVKAYKGSIHENNLGATGTAGAFTVTGKTVVNVTLTGYFTNGEGTFSYCIQVPDGAEVDRLELFIDGTHNITLPSAIVGGFISNSVNLPAGRYFLIVWLSKGIKQAEDMDGIVIYSNATTFYGTADSPIVFTDGNFKISGAADNEGLQAWNWNGFDIEGHGIQPPSMAVGTLYETFMDDGGTTWNDVLKLEPPEGGYPVDTMAMTYSITEPGDYHFSMDVWVEENAGSVDIRWAESTFPLEFYEVFNAPQNTWFRINMKYTHPEGKQDCEIGIWVNSGYWGYKLRDATLYFKDLVIEFNGEPIVDNGNVRISTGNFTLAENRTRTLTANISADWYIEPAGAAEIDVAQDGLSATVTAVSAGTATITAVPRENAGKKASVTITVVPQGSRHIAISFDDGPNGHYTPLFMEVLESKDANATFFCTGSNVNGNPELARNMVERGFEIGNHTYEHNSNNRLNEFDYLRDELLKTQIAIENAIGHPATVFRAPTLTYEYAENSGSTSNYNEKQYGYNLELAAGSLGLALIDATGHQKGNYDWDGRSADAVFERATSLAKDGGILLLHDWPPNTLEALPDILDWLHDEGYEVHSVAEMTALKNIPSLIPGRIYYDFNDPAGIPDFQGPVVPVSGITIYQGGVAVPSGGITISDEDGPITLTAEILPSNASLTRVYWYSSDDDVATVSENGVVTGIGRGSADIRAAAGVTVAKVKVTVDKEPELIDVDTLTTWDAFDWAGKDKPDAPGAGYQGSNAVGTVLNNFKPGDGFSYTNVLELAPPAGGYTYDSVLGGTVAMNYVIPQSGYYTLSMDVWVDSDASNVNLVWYVCGGSWPTLNPPEWNGNVRTNEWLSGTGPRAYIAEGTIIGLLTRNIADAIGLRDAVVYFKNLTLELEDADDPVIDIRSVKTIAPEDSAITLQWSESGTLIQADAVTISRGGTVTITAPPGLPMYQWRVVKETYTGTEATHRTFVFDSAGRALGTYTIGFYSGAEFGGDAVTITVTN